MSSVSKFVGLIINQINNILLVILKLFPSCKCANSSPRNAVVARQRNFEEGEKGRYELPEMTSGHRSTQRRRGGRAFKSSHGRASSNPLYTTCCCTELLCQSFPPSLLICIEGYDITYQGI